MFSHRNLSLYGGHQDEINCLIFSSDLEILLTGSIHGCIRIWNTVCEHLTFKIQERKGRLRALAISNNDKYFASTANGIYVRLYETRTASLVHLLSGHTYPSDCLHFSSDSQLIASGGWDYRTILWNVTTGEQVYNFHHHTNAVQSIAFHPNRNIMATGSHDHHLFLYDLEDRSLPTFVKLEGHYNNVRALTFSQLSYFASGGWDKTIIIWDMKTKRMRSRLFGHTGWIQALAFRNNDDSVLASVDDDTVCVWNIITGRCLHRLKILNDSSCFVRFLPNDTSILVGGAVYEVLFNQRMSSRTRRHIKRVREPIPAVTELIFSPKNTNIKLPKLQFKKPTE